MIMPFIEGKELYEKKKVPLNLKHNGPSLATLAAIKHVWKNFCFTLLLPECTDRLRSCHRISVEFRTLMRPLKTFFLLLWATLTWTWLCASDHGPAA